MGKKKNKQTTTLTASNSEKLIQITSHCKETLDGIILLQLFRKDWKTISFLKQKTCKEPTHTPCWEQVVLRHSMFSNSSITTLGTSLYRVLRYITYSLVFCLSICEVDTSLSSAFLLQPYWFIVF